MHTYRINNQFGVQRRNKNISDSAAKLQQTVQIKPFQNQKKNIDIQDLYAQKVLRNFKREYNLQNQHNFSQEFSQFQSLKIQKEEQRQIYFSQNSSSSNRINQTKDKQQHIMQQQSAQSKITKYPCKNRKTPISKFSYKVAGQKQQTSSPSSSSQQNLVQFKSASHSASKSVSNYAQGEEFSPAYELQEKDPAQNEKMRQLNSQRQTVSNIATPINKTIKFLNPSRQISLERKQYSLQEKISNNIASKIAKSKQTINLNKNIHSKQYSKNSKTANQNLKSMRNKPNKPHLPPPHAQTKSINQSLNLVGQKQKRQKFMGSQITRSFAITGVKSEQTRKTAATGSFRIDQEASLDGRNIEQNTASFKLQSTPPKIKCAQSGNITVKNRSPLNRSPIQSITTIINSSSNNNITTGKNRLKPDWANKNCTMRYFHEQQQQQQQPSQPQQWQHYNNNLKQLLGTQIKRSKYAQTELNKETKRKNAIAQKILLRQSSSYAIKHYKPQRVQNKEESKSQLKQPIIHGKEDQALILKGTIYIPDEKSKKQCKYKILPQHSGDNSKVNSTQGTNNISSAGSQQTAFDISSNSVMLREEMSDSKKSEIKRMKYQKKGKSTYQKPKYTTQLTSGSLQHYNNHTNNQFKKVREDQEAEEEVKDKNHHHQQYIQKEQEVAAIRRQSSISSAKSRDISNSRQMKFARYLTNILDQ